MVSHYLNLPWATKSSGDFPIVIEKLNAFKDQEAGKYPRQGAIRSYRAALARLAVSKHSLYAIHVRSCFELYISKDIPDIANDLFYLITKPEINGVGVYIQLIAVSTNTMYAKIRTEQGTYKFRWRTETQTWERLEVDMSKPWNW